MRSCVCVYARTHAGHCNNGGVLVSLEAALVFPGATTTNIVTLCHDMPQSQGNVSPDPIHEHPQPTVTTRPAPHAPLLPTPPTHALRATGNVANSTGISALVQLCGLYSEFVISEANQVVPMPWTAPSIVKPTTLPGLAKQDVNNLPVPSPINGTKLDFLYTKS